MSSRATTWESVENHPGWAAAVWLLRPLQAAIASPMAFYLAAMTVFLFRPPDLDLYHADRIATGVLVFSLMLRVLAMRDRLPLVTGVTLPLMGLACLAVTRALREPFDSQTWSLVASKFVVPFILFHAAIVVFREPRARRAFELFVIAALAYLVFTAIAFLLDARSLIFPRYILDESLGIHAERARGPFLQAVANGLSLNMLGILALVLAPKRRAVLLLWLALPAAILATMTRAVWIAFALSSIAIGFRLGAGCIRRFTTALVILGLMAGPLIFLTDNSLATTLRERTAERGPVEARMAVYEAAWTMFRERPLRGWTAGGMYEELARRMPGYHLKAFFAHNTYLSLLIEFGLPGLLLYTILFLNLFRMRRKNMRDGPETAALRRAWPILLGVFLFNAFWVDMAYQFVIGLLFTAAGMLCASEENLR